jgi:hypothetical protein
MNMHHPRRPRVGGRSGLAWRSTAMSRLRVRSLAAAAGYLARLKPLYARVGAPEGWAETVQQSRAQHKNLPAMKDEFNRAGLP